MLVIVGGPGDPRFATVENGGVSTSERERERSRAVGGPGENSKKTSSVAIGAWRLAPHIRCLPNHSEPAVELDPQRAEELLQAPGPGGRTEQGPGTGAKTQSGLHNTGRD